MKLLEKIRGINRSIQSSSGPDFADIAVVLSEILEANIYVIDVGGRLLGIKYAGNYKADERNEEDSASQSFKEDFVNYLGELEATEINLEIDIEECFMSVRGKRSYKIKRSSFFPIYAHGDRVGTLVCSRRSRKFNEEDTIIGEYGAAIFGFEFLRCRQKEEAAKDAQREMVSRAFEILSFSEKKAIKVIFSELDENEGMLVASKIADREKLTRSVIVNALRKFETADIIETQSLGMKGTYIKVKNRFIYEGLMER